MIMFTFAVILVSEESQDSQAAVDKANEELIGPTEAETIESIEEVSPPVEMEVAPTKEEAVKEGRLIDR